MKEDIKPLMWYPVVYLVTTICPLIDRLVQYESHNRMMLISRLGSFRRFKYGIARHEWF